MAESRRVVQILPEGPAAAGVPQTNYSIGDLTYLFYELSRLAAPPRLFPSKSLATCRNQLSFKAFRPHS